MKFSDFLLILTAGILAYFWPQHSVDRTALVGIGMIVLSGWIVLTIKNN